MTISFYKYQGTGNDFIILDNRDGLFDQLPESRIRILCDRRFGIGADGLMLLETDANFDFKMRYHNADGLESSMCGNGGRCLVKFARDMGIRKSLYKFLAVDGVHEGEIDLNGWVRLRMQDVEQVDSHADHFVLNTGSPHYVTFVSNVQALDVIKEGRHIRYGRLYQATGINVNFVQTVDEHTIFVRTHERGVENETLSCGTGVTASALVSAHNDVGFNQVDVNTLGGKLSVEFDRVDEYAYTNIWLTGPAEFVYKGEITV